MMKHVIEARANYRLVQGVQNFNQIIRFDFNRAADQHERGRNFFNQSFICQV